MKGRSLAPWLFGVALVLMLSGRSLLRVQPVPPNPLTFEVEMAAIQPGQSEPLIVTGATGAGDFLFIRYLTPDTFAIGYDRWGHGGPTSQPIPYVAGKRYQITVRMASLEEVYAHTSFVPSERLQVAIDGVEVIATRASYTVRAPDALWIGENPIGGSSCGPRFQGQIFRDGRPWRGGVATLFSFRERFHAWLPSAFWQAVLAIPIVCFVAWSWPRLRGLASSLPGLFRQERAFFFSAAFCTLCFAWLVTTGDFVFNYPESFGVFYEFQASSILQGRLDVPYASLPDETFVFEGRHFGYFGITPALLRLPFVVFDLGFGHLSRAFMLLYYVVCLVSGAAILRAAALLLHGPAARPSAWMVALLILNLGLGSTLFFLGSRAYIYHEANLCGAAFALIACACALRHLAAPRERWWLGALCAGLLSLHARPSVGLFALTFIGLVALVLLVRERRGSHLALGAASALGVLSFNGLSYLKFRSFEGAPFKYYIQFDAARLANIRGSNFHLTNLPFNTYTYFVRPNIQFQSRFPWLYQGHSKPKPLFPATRSDYADRTLAIPYAMPVLFVLATAGCALAWFGLPAARLVIAITWVAVLPMGLALLAAINTAHRYTSDFVPFLFCAAALGCLGLDSAPSRWRAAWRVPLVLATLWAAALSFAFALHYQGYLVWGVSDEARARYVNLRQKADALFLGGK